MIEVAYYDNMTCKQNPPEIIYPFVRTLLTWIDENDAHLTIKTKWRKAKRPLKHGKHWRWFRLLKEKNVYENYPEDILIKMGHMQISGKLTIVKGMATPDSGLEPGLEADIVVVLPAGEVALHLANHRKVHFFKHPECCWRKNIIDFGTKEELIKILEKGR